MRPISRFASLSSKFSSCMRTGSARRHAAASWASRPAETLEARQLLSGVVTAEAGTNSYTLADGQTLEVGADYDENLFVTFEGTGRVNVRGGSDLGQARFTVAANDAAAASETRVVFYGNSSAAEVTYVGGGGKLAGLYANNGSDLGNVIVDASSDQGNTATKTVLSLKNGSTTEDVVFFGSRGRDVLIAGGNIATGDLAADLSGGDDLVRFENSATIESPSGDASGLVSLQLRGGNDTVLFRGGRYDSLDLGTGQGDDRVYLVGESPSVAFSGSVDIRTANGDDVVILRGITTVEQTTTIETGAGDDLVRIKNLSLADPIPLVPVNDFLTIDVGTNTEVRDRVEIGGVTAGGGTDINFGGDVVIRETAANRYRPNLAVFDDGVLTSPPGPALRIAGGTDGSDAIVRLEGGSFLVGSFEYDSPAKTSLVMTDFRTTEAVRIQTGRNDDSIRLSSGVAGAGIDVEVGDGNDRVRINRGQQVGGGIRIGGDDGTNVFQVFETEFVDADLSPLLSMNFDGGASANNIAQVRNLEGEPDFIVSYAGRTRIEELSAMALGQVRIGQIGRVSGNAPASPIAYRGNSGSSAAGLRIEAAYALQLIYNGSIGELGLRVDTTFGNFADSINLVRADIAGSVQIDTGGQADLVNLFDARIGGSVSVNLGGGNDTLDNRRTVFADDNVDLNGGGGNDAIGDADNGDNRNFEATI